MKREKISIKWKIFFYLAGFTVILLVVLWLFQICYLDTFYKMIKKSEAEAVQEEMVSLLQEEATDLSEQIDRLAAENNLSILVADTDGNTVYSADYFMNSRMSVIPAEVFQDYYQRALDNQGSIEIEFEGNRNKTFDDRTDFPKPEEKSQENNEIKQNDFVQNKGQEMAESVIYVNVVENGTDTRVLMMTSQLTPIDATVNTLKVQLVYISLIMIILSIGIAILISKKISKPIIRINQSAKELAKGNFQVQFDGKDYKEITELSNTLNFAANELDKTEEFRQELIANVSHDLRTPLTMIIAYSEVMRDLPDENTPENIQVVIDESRRLTNLVNDMLDLSKLQAGVLEKNATIYNLTQSIHSVMERYHKLKEQDGYNIQFDYQQEVWVEADEFKIYQVIYNLVNNAINYAGKDKCITVHQRVTQDHYVRIEVCDTGEGISKEALPYVWDRYYKVDKTHKRAVAGTGLGLSIVKNILNLHKARYGVESEPGKGSTFWFELKCSRWEKEEER